MGENAPGDTILMNVLITIAASLVLLVIGIALRKRGRLASRGAAMLWAVLTILPLFGAGALMFVRHTADMASGQTRSGVDQLPKAH